MRPPSCLLSLALCAPLAWAGDEVTWRGKTHPIDALPAELEAPARQAVLDWRPWIKQLAYRMDLNDKARVLVISPADGGTPEHALALVDRTVALFEQSLPVPTRRTQAVANATTPDKKAATSKATPEPLPEDPEEPPVGAPAPRAMTTTASTDPTPPPVADPLALLDRRTAVLVLLEKGDDYGPVLQYLAHLEPYLAGWTERAKTQTGFVLERPLAGAMILAQPSQEEWNPDNEIVNRTMQLCVLNRFGTQPFWVQQGLAWFAEFGVLKSVYCFPYRDGFVGVEEHTDWDKDLAWRFEKREKKPVDVSEFADWKRGTYDGACARIAWGVIDYLARNRPRDLAALLEDLRFERDLKDRRVKNDGSWERIPDFELALEDQKRILTECLGPRTLPDLSAAWRRAGAKD